ncbi:MAG: hypothetical protein A3J62_00285 [Candidatus Buchananbacteria bacterium RIFCSPHIGHO2_02_FULL_38_8]|uniref:Uncharacterized protein n=1 Tax=Candidatus Buchananbacteria bacterium RIFCSPHIGHO2_02_FULL_38_8 TaxID=1797538 RepID=A0A1G1Y4R2_9BACT|nr:MAG: hypothetical protein A3J62_00285 [Candidatus Buchananbacteria bacterium RIFCSPHIGHO2_02_FULL_38_8]
MSTFFCRFLSDGQCICPLQDLEIIDLLIDLGDCRFCPAKSQILSTIYTLLSQSFVTLPKPIESSIVVLDEFGEDDAEEWPERDWPPFLAQ